MKQSGAGKSRAQALRDVSMTSRLRNDVERAVRHLAGDSLVLTFDNPERTVAELIQLAAFGEGLVESWPASCYWSTVQGDQLPLALAIYHDAVGSPDDPVRIYLGASNLTGAILTTLKDGLSMIPMLVNCSWGSPGFEDVIVAAPGPTAFVALHGCSHDGRSAIEVVLWPKPSAESLDGIGAPLMDQPGSPIYGVSA